MESKERKTHQDSAVEGSSELDTGSNTDDEGGSKDGWKCLTETAFSDSDAVKGQLPQMTGVMQRDLQRGQQQHLHGIMDKCWKLNRKKNIICLILSYPPFNSLVKEKHKGWILDVLEITHKVRQLTEPSMEKEINISELSSKISGLLDHSIHDIEAYVPPHIIEEMQWGTLWGRAPTKKMLALATDFAIRQILQDTVFRRIRISGTDGTTFMSRWKIQEQITDMFNIVLQVNASSCKTTEDIEDSIARELGLSTCNKQDIDELLKNRNFLILLVEIDPLINLYEVGARWWNSEKIQKIISRHELRRFDSLGVDLEIRLADHLLSWKLFHTNVGNVLHSSSIQYQAVNVLKHCCGHLLVTVLMARALKDVQNIRVWEHASHSLNLIATSQTKDRILFNALVFILGRLGSASECLKSCESYLESKGMDKIDLIERWMKGGLIRTLDEGEEIIQDLFVGEIGYFPLKITTSMNSTKPSTFDK